ncbi:hypothetical protein [Streptomyces canus]|uniref:hypothetical protein n=1 Tax=Streptomyces canus TaxID=58343 RepID=UPI002E26CABA
MPHSVPLSTRQADRLITALRHGQDLDDAVTTLGLDMAAVWPTARTHPRLAVALAGRDPDTDTERGRLARADFLRLLALGLPPSVAELALAEGDPGRWRGEDPAYAQACAAASTAADAYASRARTRRMTPKVTRTFLDALTAGTTVEAAAAAAGITKPAVYQRRRRDSEFAAAMDAARATAER